MHVLYLVLVVVVGVHVGKVAIKEKATKKARAQQEKARASGLESEGHGVEMITLEQTSPDLETERAIVSRVAPEEQHPTNQPDTTRRAKAQLDKGRANNQDDSHVGSGNGYTVHVSGLRSQRHHRNGGVCEIYECAYPFVEEEKGNYGDCQSRADPDCALR